MNITLHNLLEEARRVLDLEVFPEREEELIRIIEDVFMLKKHEIYQYDELVTYEQFHRWNSIILQRSTGKPLAHILGYTYFYHDRFPVSEQTLIPRYDTEHLVECVRKYYQHTNPSSILDIGTGTGVIALSLHRLFPDTKITAVDVVVDPFMESLKCLNIESENVSIKLMNFLDQSQWMQIDCVDCIVSNPPYLNTYDMEVLEPQVRDFEPHTALYGGFDGMLFYNAIVEFACDHLNSGGIVVLEVDHKYQDVQNMFLEKIFMCHQVIYDYQNLPRVFFCVKR